MQEKKCGRLYVVATPIGNLNDITFRAVEILKKVDRIIAEDTRHSRILLNYYSISKPLLSLHDFNERTKINSIVDLLFAGESLGFITDAGTPLISDPGYHLVKEIRKLGITIVPIPGPSAVITALSVAGIPTDSFIFQGFFPSKIEAKKHVLESLMHETRTMVFYEAPSRLLTTLKLMAQFFTPEREIMIARELTKKHESILQDKIGGLIAYFQQHTEKQRGEFTIVVRGEEKKNATPTMVASEKVMEVLSRALPIKQAALLTSEITGERKNDLYKKALQRKQKKYE